MNCRSIDILYIFITYFKFFANNKILSILRFAVVTHKGRDADGGHYMGWVKAEHQSSDSNKIADTDEDNDDWFVFDDDEVSPCKTEDILKLKGGGDWHMSYMNFYRAKK